MKKKTDANELMDRAYDGKLTEEQVTEVIERLKGFVIEDIHDDKYLPSEKQKMSDCYSRGVRT